MFLYILKTVDSKGSYIALKLCRIRLLLGVVDSRENRREEEAIEHKKNGRRAAVDKPQNYLTILYTLDRDKQGEFTQRINILKEWELRPLTGGPDHVGK